jgi:hypothetical protein
MLHSTAAVVFGNSSSMSIVQGSELLTRTGHVGVSSLKYIRKCAAKKLCLDGSLS